MLAEKMFRTRIQFLIGLALLLQLIGISTQFHLPGLPPVNYCKRSEASNICKPFVTLYVNRLDSNESTIPYDYNRFDFCSADETNSPLENLDQLVFGDRLQPGPYKIEFLKDIVCELVCQKNYTGGDADSESRLMMLKHGISLNYQHHWVIDNKSVTWYFPYENSKPYWSTGFPMGCLVRSKSEHACPFQNKNLMDGYYYPFNHVDLVINYQSGINAVWGSSFKASGGRIISVKATPRSINHKNINSLDCSNSEPFPIRGSSLERNENFSLIYTYSVKFVANNTI